MNENFEYKNYHVISGPIVNIFKAGKAVLVTVMTGQGKEVKNFPQAVCFNELAEKAETFKIGDRVRFECKIQSRRVENKETGRKEYSQSLIASSLEPMETVLESAFGIKGGMSKAPENYFELAGEVVRIDSPAPNIARLVVHTVIEGKNSFITCSKMEYKPGEVMGAIQVGDFVAGIGMTQTSKKEKDGKTLYYKNVTFKDLAKVDFKKEESTRSQ